MASTSAVSSLSNKTTGSGDTVDFTSAKSRVSAMVVSRGTVTDGVVLIQASQDSTNWATVGVVSPRTGVNQGFDHNKGAYRYWRAVVGRDVAGGGSVDVTFMEGQ